MSPLRLLLKMDFLSWTSELLGELEFAFSIGAQNQAEHEERMPLGVIVYVAAAGLAQALWLGLIGWWVLNLF